MIENYKRVYFYYLPYKSSSNNIKVELDFMQRKMMLKI